MKRSTFMIAQGNKMAIIHILLTVLDLSLVLVGLMPMRGIVLYVWLTQLIAQKGVCITRHQLIVANWIVSRDVLLTRNQWLRIFSTKRLLDGDSKLKQQATSHSLETDRVAAFFQSPCRSFRLNLWRLSNTDIELVLNRGLALVLLDGLDMVWVRPWPIAIATEPRPRFLYPAPKSSRPAARWGSGESDRGLNWFFASVRPIKLPHARQSMWITLHWICWLLLQAGQIGQPARLTPAIAPDYRMKCSPKLVQVPL